MDVLEVIHDGSIIEDVEGVLVVEHWIFSTVSDRPHLLDLTLDADLRAASWPSLERVLSFGLATFFWLNWFRRWGRESCPLIWIAAVRLHHRLSGESCQERSRNWG